MDLDPLNQVLTRQMRAEWWQAGQLVAEEEYTLTGNFYFKHELLLMLEQGGFADFIIQGDYTKAEATPEHGGLVFIARKPSPGV